jgi:SH3 domain-containing protein/YmgG-like glycine-zipper protein
MGKKLGIFALCFLLVSQGLAGCADMTEQQKDTATGAGIGAVVGGVLGGVIGHKNPLAGVAVGAAAGALVGGLIGWKVGEYKMEKVKDAGQSAAAKEYKPEQGVVAKIENTAAAPQQLKPGDQVVLQTEYTVLSPPDKGEVKVKEVRTIIFNSQELGRLEKDSTLSAGTYTSQHKVTLPSDAAQGTYTVATLVEPVGVEKATNARATTAFVVGTGEAAPSAPPPASAPQAGAAVAPSAPSTAKPSGEDRLRQLDDLKAKGLVGEQEYKQRRDAILAEILGGPAPAGATQASLPSQAPPPPAKTSLPEAVYVKGTSVNIREAAGTDFKVVAKVQKGTKLFVMEEAQKGKEKWYRVKLEDGREGWVASSLVSAER